VQLIVCNQEIITLNDDVDNFNEDQFPIKSPWGETSLFLNQHCLKVEEDKCI